MRISPSSFYLGSFAFASRGTTHLSHPGLILSLPFSFLLGNVAVSNADNYTQCIKTIRLTTLYICRVRVRRVSLIVCNTRVYERTCQERVSVTTPRVSGLSQFWRCMRPYWNARRLVATAAVMSAPIGIHTEACPDVPSPRPISRPHARHDKRLKVRRFAGRRVCSRHRTRKSCSTYGTNA